MHLWTSSLLVNQQTGEDIDPHAVEFFPRPKYTRSAYILNLPENFPDLFRAYKKDITHRDMTFSEFVAYRELIMYQNAENEAVNAHDTETNEYLDQREVNLVQHAANSSGINQVSDVRMTRVDATDDDIDNIDVSAETLAVSSADEEEKVDFIDVKNDVKNNSSTTNYLPTFFEYFDYSTRLSPDSLTNLSVDCCLDGEFYFDTVGSSFMPPVDPSSILDDFVSKSTSYSSLQGTRDLCVCSQMCNVSIGSQKCKMCTNGTAPTTYSKNCTFDGVSGTQP